MKNIVIIGAGDFGREVIWLLEDINKVSPQYVILGYVDDDEKKQGLEYQGYRVLGKIEYLMELQKRCPVSAVIAMQDGTARKQVVDRLEGFGSWERLIHPTAVISDTVKIGQGTIICANVTVSVDTVVGRHCIFYLSSTIGNDCVFGDFTSVMSNSSIGEHSVIGQESFFAAHSFVAPHKNVGNRVRVGVGSSVLKDIKDGSAVTNEWFGLGLFR